MANNLTFDNFSFKNKQRCELDYHQPLMDWDADALFDRVDDEWGELVVEVEHLKIAGHGGRIPSDNYRQRAIDEACDVMILLDLFIQRLGGVTSKEIADKFNRTSDKIGSQIKIPV